MKVDNNRDYLTTTDPLRVDADRTSAAGARPSTTGPVTDQVTLSSDAQFLQAAEKAAQDAPNIRPDAVARARALLDQGQVGTDLDALASSILDSLTKS
jgi:flagellar biosynthesis anti-sigma factor FlgM